QIPPQNTRGTESEDNHLVARGVEDRGTGLRRCPLHRFHRRHPHRVPSYCYGAGVLYTPPGFYV
ncbi:hypothetical protein H0H92_002790, partial [Tricholoma furcatifolium]